MTLINLSLHPFKRLGQHWNKAIKINNFPMKKMKTRKLMLSLADSNKIASINFGKYQTYHHHKKE